MTADSSPENSSPATGVQPVAMPSQSLEALPGPAWIVDCSSLEILQRNAAADALSGDAEFSALFPARLDGDLLERLRSPQPQVGFHAVFAGDQNPWLFSAGSLPGVPRQRLILAQPSVVFDVPAQLTFDELLDSAFDGLVILDAGRRVVQISARFQEMFGYSIEELRGKTPEVLVPAGCESEFRSGDKLLDRGGVQHLETRRLRRDGRLLEVLVRSQPIASGRFRGGLVLIYRDLTLVNQNTRYHNLRLDATRILATAATVEEAARELLPVMAKVLDWSEVRLWLIREDGLECVYGYSITDCYCSSDSQGVEAPCSVRAEDVARDGRSVWVSDFHPRASCNGNAHCRLRHGSLAAFPIIDTHKQVLGVLELLAPNRPLTEPAQRELIEGICVHLCQFITRCKAELALAENEAKFRTLAEMAPIAIFIHSDGVILYANAAFESISGYSRDEISHCSVWRLFHPEDLQDTQERAKRRQRGENVKERWEVRIIRKNGELRWIDYSAARITLGNRSAVLAAGSDITDRRAFEMQLRQTQKMEAIGLLAGGIAHDFNNLLMVIGCCSETISLSDGLPEEIRRGAEEISHAADRGAALTRQLLAFSRHQVLAPRLIALNSVLTGTELILRRALGDDIVLKFDLDPAIGSILADSSQIEQVVMNLAVNARDAMPDGGALTISTSSVRLDEATPQAGNQRCGTYVVLTVADRGIGMNPEVQQHIFEPFFTTKHASKGTGLGLFTVYGIVKQSGGFVTLESQPNRGATFKVFLPIVSEVPVAAATAQDQELAAAVSGTILLVEDEAEVRAVLHRGLIRDGHTVMEASGGAQALKLSAAYEGTIDLLLTDVVMSEMSGRDLADRLVQIRPGLKVLYVSGYNEDTVLQKGVVEGQMEFLQKPFSPSALSRKVRQLLSS